MKTIRFLSVGFLFAAVIVDSSHALSLIPDVAVPLPGTTSMADPFLAGTIIEDDSVAFSIPTPAGPTTGFIQERVTRETVAGTLDFYWRVVVETGASVGALRLGDFFPSFYDANWRSDGSGTVSPASARLFSGVGGFVNFGFDPGVAAGQSSYFMFLHTDATAYDRSALMDVSAPGFDFISESFQTFAPAAASVPDPGSTLLLLGLAAGGLAAFRRKLA